MQDFDPNNVTPQIANRIADSLESYLKLLTSIRVAPPEIEKKYGADIAEGDKRTRKLIKKLRKWKDGGMEGVFKEDI